MGPNGAYLPATPATQAGALDFSADARGRAYQQRRRVGTASFGDSEQNEQWRPVPIR